MPNKSPRIQVTVTPQQYELLSRVASLRGESRSKVVSELVETIEPMLERMVVVLEAASKAQSDYVEGLRQGMERAESDIMPLMRQALDQFDMFLAEQEKATGVSSEVSLPSAQRGVETPGKKRRKG